MKRLWLGIHLAALPIFTLMTALSIEVSNFPAALLYFILTLVSITKLYYFLRKKEETHCRMKTTGRRKQ